MTRNQKWMAGSSALCLAMILASCEKPAPPDTREADAKAITELEDSWSKVIGTKDAAKFASYYAPDASLYATGLPAMHGAGGISKGLKELMADPNFSSTFKTSGVHVAKSGDLAYSEGTFAQTATDPTSKKKVSEKGNYVTCWMKQADGRWKAVADITAAEPAAQPPTAATKIRGAPIRKKKAANRKRSGHQ
jgi:uncharacterized protein (TIGR02246 family)